jgi:hypothetical protein
MDHSPINIPSPDGTGIARTYGCSCGSNPTKGAASATSQPAWFKGHLRKMGVTVNHETLRSMFLNAPRKD